MTIAIENLEFEAIIGILDYERTTPQKVVVDLIVEYHYNKNSFINYVDLRDLIRSSMINGKFGLIEEALDLISKKILDLNSTIDLVDLTIKKPDVLNDCTVSVRTKLIRS